MNDDKKTTFIIYGVLSLLVLFIIVYTMILVNKKEDKTDKLNQTSFEAPKLEEVKYQYNRKIDLLKEKEFLMAQKGKHHSNDIETNVNDVSPLTFVAEEEKQETVIKEKPKVIYVSTPTSKKVTKEEGQPVIEDEPKQRRKKRTLSVEDDKQAPVTKIKQTIHCKVYGDQRVKNNSKLKVRVTRDVTVNNTKIKRNSIFTGIVRFSQSRVNIYFETVQYNGKSIPIKMQAYSRDGLSGIYIEGEIQDEVKKDILSETIEETASSTTNRIPIIGPIIGTTVQKQNRETYVNIPNDYTLFLRQ